MDHSLTEMGKRIAARRNELHLTQEAVAEQMDVSFQTISCVELGKQAIRLNNFIRLCQVLDVSADYILFGKRSKKQMTSLTDKISRLSERDYQMLMQFIDRLI